MSRKVYILLTRFEDTGARTISALTMSKYNHASIGLEEDMNTFYSFVLKGFIVEKITRYVKKYPIACQLYELNVSDKAYDTIKRIISKFEENKCQLGYTRFGVLMSLLKIKYKKKNRYFCSHFVAEMLKLSNAAILKKRSAMYFPRDFKKIPGLNLKFQGNLKSFIQHFGIENSVVV